MAYFYHRVVVVVVVVIVVVIVVVFVVDIVVVDIVVVVGGGVVIFRVAETHNTRGGRGEKAKTPEHETAPEEREPVAREGEREGGREVGGGVGLGGALTQTLRAFACHDSGALTIQADEVACRAVARGVSDAAFFFFAHPIYYPHPSSSLSPSNS